MRYLLVWIFAWVAACAAENIHWSGAYDKARLQAITQKKKLLLFLNHRQCQTCRKMLATTLKDPRCVSLVNRGFVAVIVNFESPESYPIELFYTQEFPTIFLIDPKNESLVAPALSGFYRCGEIQRILQSTSQSR